MSDMHSASENTESKSTGSNSIRAELPWFSVGHYYGSNQGKMSDPWLRFGGCAAVTAVDCSIYFALYKHKKKICPYDLRTLTMSRYNTIAAAMKPYLHPRYMGVNKLVYFTDGYGRWLQDHGETKISVEAFYLDHSETEARSVLKAQIDSGLPVCFLLLSHKSPSMKEWFWHWFVLNGYEESADGAFRVKAVTYGEAVWLDFSILWNTGFKQDGGMIIYRML